MPVALGGLRTRCGVSETKRVPRRRWSRTAGGRGELGGTGGNNASCRLLVACLPAGMSGGRSATARPAALQTHSTSRLRRDRSATIRTRRAARGRYRARRHGFLRLIHDSFGISSGMNTTKQPDAQGSLSHHSHGSCLTSEKRTNAELACTIAACPAESSARETK